MNEKENNGTVQSKWKSNLSISISVITLLTWGITVLTSSIRNGDLTFDSQKQKHEVLISLKKGHPIGQKDAMHTIDHSHDADIHMSLEEKNNLIRIEESLKTLTLDVKEIKELVKKKSNN